MSTKVNPPKQTEKPPKTLRIGIYGCTNAGKTTFLYALLEYWMARKRILPRNTAVLEFIERTAAEVEAYGSVRPTTAESTDLAFTLRRDRSEGDLDITCRDLRGELLSDDLDVTNPAKGSGALRGQIEECDAFLFFFDPTAKEHQTAPERHYEREFQRAEKFLDAVLSTRENRYLPIVFVLTHHDQWQRDAVVSANVQRWKTRLIDRMREAYRSRYKGLRPPVLTNREQVFVETAAAVRSDESNQRLEAVIHRLAALSRRCKEFRRGVAFWLVAALASIAIVIPATLYILSLPPHEPPGKTPGKTVAELLKRHENELGLSGPADSSQLAAHARKLHVILMNLRTWSAEQASVGPRPTASDATKAASMLKAAARRLIEDGEAVGQDRDTRLQLLGVALGGLRAPADATSDPLTPACEIYWRLAGEKSRATLRATVDERTNVGSDHSATLRTLAADAADLKKEIESHAVATTSQGERLIAQLRETQTFCDDRANAGAYSVFITVDGEQKTDGDLPLAPRRFVIDSKAEPVFSTPLIPADNEQSLLLRARIRWGGDAWSDYENDVALTLGGARSGPFDAFRDGAFKANVTSRPGKTSDLGTFAGATRGNEQLAVTIDVNVSREHWFVVYSRQHGELKKRTVSLADLVSNAPDPHRLKLEGKGSKGNILELTTALASSLRYVPTKNGPQEVAIPLGPSLRCLIYVGDDPPARSAKPLIDFSPIAKPGPLAVLGMPLFQSRTQSKTTAQGTDAAGKFTVNVEFSCKSTAPDLLWDITTESDEQGP